jgi:hypothetical protein
MVYFPFAAHKYSTIRQPNFSEEVFFGRPTLSALVRKRIYNYGSASGTPSTYRQVLPVTAVDANYHYNERGRRGLCCEWKTTKILLH